MLNLVETVPLSLLPGIATRIKLLSGLDIAERRLPQDGRMRLSIRGQEVDMRVSVMPSVHGETMVLRLLNRDTVSLDLDTLGFDPDSRNSLESLVRLQNGIILVTGPTGSGKTTTLYALLQCLMGKPLKIFTVEDPVEYKLGEITQIQVRSSIGLTFARALRSILRQDPDVILIGEIRDEETAEIAIQAALTGHLVLSTLHTNSAVGAITRLRDMGIPNYLIGATIRGVVGQRLLRRLNNYYQTDTNPSSSRFRETGYSGRIASFEIAVVDEAVSKAISAGCEEDALRDLLTGGGMVPIRKHAESLVAKGTTDMQELLRVMQPASVRVS